MAGRKRYKCGTCGEMRSYDDLAEFSFSGVHILCFECQDAEMLRTLTFPVRTGVAHIVDGKMVSVLKDD